MRIDRKMKKNDELKQTFARRLQKARNLRKMRIADMEFRTKILGFHITEYEEGVRLPSCNTLIALANALTVSTDYLLGLSNNPTRNYEDPPPPPPPDILSELLDQLEESDKKLFAKVLRVTIKHIALKKGLPCKKRAQ